jgi:hypothetical protein
MKNSEINKQSIFEHLHSFTVSPNFRANLGKTWYLDKKEDILNNNVLSLPLKGLISLNVYLAVVSILSPANKWNNNLWDAHFLVHRFFGISTNKDYKYFTYGANVDKAELLLKRVYLLNWSEKQAIETALLVKTSLKTWNFYNNLKDSFNNEYLTIDRHILTIIGIDSNQITPANYLLIKEIIVEYFYNEGLEKEYSLASFQAVLWCNHLFNRNKPNGL